MAGIAPDWTPPKDQYGEPIATNGVRPPWLRDGDDWEWTQGGRYFTKTRFLLDGYIWERITHIRLPASSPVYTAINAGFEPWRGGDHAPNDWDGGDVLAADCGTLGCSGIARWKHIGAGGDIIGYRKRAEPAQPTEAQSKSLQDALIASANEFVPPIMMPAGSFSRCDKCGMTYPSAPAGTVHKCGRCSGGYCHPTSGFAAQVEPTAEPKAELPNGWTEEALSKRAAEYSSGHRTAYTALKMHIATHETPPDPVGDKAQELWEVYAEASPAAQLLWDSLRKDD